MGAHEENKVLAEIGGDPFSTSYSVSHSFQEKHENVHTFSPFLHSEYDLVVCSLDNSYSSEITMEHVC